MKSLKTLGTRTETKREKVHEALILENLGKGNEETSDILYEEHEVKEWEDRNDHGEITSDGNQQESSVLPNGIDDEDDDQHKISSFIDYRPRGPQGMGFGFQTVKKLAPKKERPAYNWRARLEQEKARKKGISMYDDDESSDEESEDESDSESDGNSAESEDDVNEEWYGFDVEPKTVSEDIEEEEDDEDDEEELDQAEAEQGQVNSNEEEYSDDSENSPSAKTKGQKFKEWANNLNHPEEERLETPIFKGEYIPLDRSEDTEELPAEYTVPANIVNRKSYFVNVERNEEIQRARLELPVVSEEQRIMEAIHNHDTVVICGETGSGKTTQVPQFLFEAGYGHPNSKTPGMIGITQPRRVAAVSMANRVSNELGNYGDKVGYQIRFDATVKSDTAMKFMTDGVLLRELANDFVLSKYSCIIIDEAHERNINTDILIGVLSRVVTLRRQMSEEQQAQLEDKEKTGVAAATANKRVVTPLKLVIMSATLRVSDFTENTALFSVPPPVLKVEARQYPVSVHFNRRTSYNYVDEAYKKAVKIHQRLPPGGILIFLTGQNEINQVCRKLTQAFPFKVGRNQALDKQQERSFSRVRVSAQEAVTEVEDIEFGVDDDEQSGSKVIESKNSNNGNGIVDDYDDFNDDDEDEDEGFDETIEDGQDINAPLHVLPLYSLLPTKDQMKVFQDPPAGSRLCVVATNVAETSLTIPGIRYVVDCGRSKERHYDEESGVQSFKISWTSKASADQRSGRAGRTGPGHCYRIYSSAVFESDFDQFSRPEILRMPIEGLVLQMKSMGIDNIINFPFPSPPPSHSLQKGVKLLQYLGALTDSLSGTSLTELGRSMSLFPLSPRFAKMLIISNQHRCLPYIIAIVAALTVGDPFLSQEEVGVGRLDNADDDDAYDDDDSDFSVQVQEAKRQLRKDFFSTLHRFSSLDSKCDALKILSAVCAYDYDKDHSLFCRRNFLRFKTMEEISKLRKQLSYLVAVNTRPGAVDSTIENLNSKLGPPSTIQIKALKQMIAAGFIDQIAARADVVSTDIKVRSKQRVISYPYIPLFPITKTTTSTGGSLTRQEQLESQDPYVYIHPGSILSNLGASPPEYLIYFSVHMTESHKADQAPKVKMKVLTDIGPSQLANVARSSALLTYSKPLGPPYGPRTISPTKRECWVVPRLGAAIGSGSVGWDLPAKKVIQEKEGLNWIVKSDA